MFSFKHAFIALAKDAAYTFSSNHCPTVATDDNLHLLSKASGDNGGLEKLTAEDWKGLTVLTGIVLLIGGGLGLLACGRIAFAEFMAIIGPPVTYLYAKGSK